MVKEKKSASIKLKVFIQEGILESRGDFVNNVEVNKGEVGVGRRGCLSKV